MENLLRMLNEIRPDLDFTIEERLFDDGVIDSFDIISIVTKIEEGFGVSIDVIDIVPESFNSAAAIWDLIARAKGA